MKHPIDAGNKKDSHHILETQFVCDVWDTS